MSPTSSGRSSWEHRGRSSWWTTSPGWVGCWTREVVAYQASAVRDMLEMMGEPQRLDTAAIQTVGTKDWDGFAIAVVK